MKAGSGARLDADLRFFLGALCLVAPMAGGCTTTTEPAPAAAQAAPRGRQAVRPISLPELSKVSPSVRKQLGDEYASLTAKTQSPTASDRDLGNAYGEMGMYLFAAEYRDVAEVCLSNAQALTPDEFRWPYYLAQLHKSSGNSPRSVAAFERALQLKPDDLPTLVWLGSAYLDQGLASDAEPLLSKALSIDPRSVVVLFDLGRVALARQEYGRAIDYLEQARSIDPRAAVIHYPLAMAYRGAGNMEQAEAHLKQRGPGELRPPDPLMLRLDTLLESAVAYEVRGAAALDAGQWAAAADYFTRGIALAPNEPSMRHKLGTALAMMGNSQAAFEQFLQVTERWPTFAKGQYSLGVMLASAARYKEAIEHLSAAVKSDPTYVEARLQLAEALRASGRAQESLPHYEQAARLDPRLAEARLGSAMALAALGRFDEARRQLTEGQKMYPARPEFADMLARLPAAPAEHR